MARADLTCLENALESILEYLSEDSIIVIKSTVPIGTGDRLEQWIKTKTKQRFYLINNPEFLKEGHAVEDFMRPDRIIIGSEDIYPRKKMEDIYSPFLRQGNSLYFMSRISAELTKYAANSFLATKISFINEMARLCDIIGADIEEVVKGISSDKRIGRDFFYPGPGYGGSCFPKDISAINNSARERGLDLQIIQATEKVNQEQKRLMFQKAKSFFKGNLRGRRFAFWGVAFKANTDDIRESAAIVMTKEFVEEGAEVYFYDPIAQKNYIREMSQYLNYSNKVFPVNNMYDCLDNSDGLVVMTEWREFKNTDLKEIKTRLKVPVIFDARNIFDTDKVLENGFDYFAFGKRVFKKMKIAIYQLTSNLLPENNIKKIREAAESLQIKGVQALFLPECFLLIK